LPTAVSESAVVSCGWGLCRRQVRVRPSIRRLTKDIKYGRKKTRPPTSNNKQLSLCFCHFAHISLESRYISLKGAQALILRVPHHEGANAPAAAGPPAAFLTHAPLLARGALTTVTAVCLFACCCGLPEAARLEQTNAIQFRIAQQLVIDGRFFRLDFVPPRNSQHTPFPIDRTHRTKKERKEEQRKCLLF
jgi:hypothetical protein